ncbi:MAG: inorganic phosphate transporter [Archaeoglobus sp.]|nr:MAG: inorganic phosphate transporter [Archaeoglobus sp.]
MLSEIAISIIAFSIGSNNTSNAFGVPVGCGVISFRMAILLIGIFVTVGSLTQVKVLETVGSIAKLNCAMILIVLVVSACMIVILNWKKLPVSSHQAIVGSMIGAGVVAGTAKLSVFASIVISWIISPIGALILAIVIYILSEKIFSRIPVFVVERLLYIMLIISGILIAYNTGANELASALAPVVSSKLIPHVEASVLGSASLIAGALILGGRVIETVGKDITTLDPLSGFSAQGSAGLTVFLFTLLGMPVSTTYCLIGGIVGVGLLKGVNAVKIKLLKKIVSIWIVSPLTAFMVTYIIARVVL